MSRTLIGLLTLPVLLFTPTALAQSQVDGTATFEEPSVSVDSAAPSSAEPHRALPPDSSTNEATDTEGFEGPSVLHEHVDDYVGASAQAWLYEGESPVYRMAPPFRYNRVEGPVVGLRRDPLQLASSDQARILGQLAYALALRDLRYSVGVESRLYSTPTTGLKIGALYQKQTLSPDRWKTSYLENSLASLGFKRDFFDYYEAEGVTLYAVQTLPHSLQLTAGVRTEIHRSLSKHTNWSVFKGGTFRSNPTIDEGRIQIGILRLTGGQVENLDDLPTGRAFHVAATVGNRSAAPSSFARYEADGRLYLPLTPESRFALRVRGGYATSSAPLQMQFSLGGIGTVRSYAQNRYRGTRMLLGNVEYLIDGATVFDALLDDLFLAGLLDAGWVGGPNEVIRLDEVLPSAGVGIGLDERRIRLDVSWPLRDRPGAGPGPSLWLRIAPNF